MPRQSRPGAPRYREVGGVAPLVTSPAIRGDGEKWDVIFGDHQLGNGLPGHCHLLAHGEGFAPNFTWQTL
jgi:hypothetical protein